MRRLLSRIWDDFPRYAPWGAFLLTLITYWLTVEPGASLWDCPEYIDGALRLEIGHPPGNPTWLLFHRVVSLFGFTQSGAVLAVNLASGFFSAWAVGLLCASSQRTLKLLVGSPRVVAWCSLLGALCFGWSESVWFSAVEAEVYAMSLWMSALCIWLSLKWFEESSTGRRWQYICLIAYVLGLSVGVHQLTMLVIPAIALIICYRHYRTRRANGRQWLCLFAGIAVVAAILIGLMKLVPRVLAFAELLAVNSLSLPYHSGALGGWVVILLLLGLGAWCVGRMGRREISGVMWCMFFCCIGFSSYILIPLRANALPPMNQGNPSDIFSFITYIDRDQYGGAPLVKGSTPFSTPLKREHLSINDKGDTVRSYYGHVKIKIRPYYSQRVDGGRIADYSGFISAENKKLNDSLAKTERDAYLLTGYKSRQVMNPELEMWFPRIHASSEDKIEAYEDWCGMTDSTMEEVLLTEAADSLGNPVSIRDATGKPRKHYGLKPTLLQNLQFFAGYQCGYMYFRYLMWNFSGRQNDIHSTGEVEHGNFITGITPIDNAMLGAEDALPAEAGSANAGRNRFFMLPLILGLAGILWLCTRGYGGRRIAFVSGILFLMTGLAIVVYLNQSPGEPRERDYSFPGSFWVFGFWIASGFLMLLNLLRNSKTMMRLVAVVCAALPLWMLAENFDDHDRSGRYPADEYAELVLRSLPENTILFTSGDNHTFPLWYARNSRGIRPDVTIVNTNYLQLPWEVLRIMMTDETGNRVRMTMSPADVVYGGMNVVRVGGDTVAVGATDALKAVYADSSLVPSFPGTQLLIFGREAVKVDLQELYGVKPGGFLNLKQLAMLDIVATNAESEKPRPIAWHHSLAGRKYEGWNAFTTSLPFAVVWDPLGMADEKYSRENILATKPISRPGGRYIDPVYGGLITYQRIALMTDARRALEGGDTTMAVRLLDYLITRFPFDEWGPQLKGFRGETIDEAILFAELARRTASSWTVSKKNLIDSLILNARQRRDEWRSYREKLPRRLRPAMTPTSRRLAMPADSI